MAKLQENNLPAKTESFLKRKYERWGDFLKARRHAKFRSAREFCAKESIGISYPQYSRYEAGDQLPSLEHALVLCGLLDIPILEGLLEWNRAQIHDPKASCDVDNLLLKVRTSAQAGQIEGGAQSSLVPSKKNSVIGDNVSLEDLVVFNRSHLKLFESDNRYRDIFTYVNSFSPEWITADELSKALEIEMRELEPMLDQLNDLGVILVGGNRCRSTKTSFYFPDDAEFFGLRNSNVKHNVEAVLQKMTPEKITEKKAYRGLISREFSEEQIQAIHHKLEEILSQAATYDQPKDPQEIYSVCVLLGERFKRPAKTA
jgi:hypothetical protein